MGTAGIRMVLPIDLRSSVHNVSLSDGGNRGQA